MSLVIATPELITEAASDLQSIGTTLNAAHITAAAPAFAVLPAAADEVSASIAQVFSGYGQEYQKLAGRAAAFHEQFVQHLNASADMYGGAEAVNGELLQPMTSTVESILTASGLQKPIYDLFTTFQYQLGKAFFESQLGPMLYAALAISVLVGFFGFILGLATIILFANSIGAGDIVNIVHSAIGPTSSALIAIA